MYTWNYTSVILHLPAAFIYYFSAGNINQPIWLDDILCPTDEVCLQSCQKCSKMNHDCTHLEDVTVSCGQQTNCTMQHASVIRLYRCMCSCSDF